jgi:hypothetical protein
VVGRCGLFFGGGRSSSGWSSPTPAIRLRPQIKGDVDWIGVPAEQRDFRVTQHVQIMRARASLRQSVS